MCAFDNIKPIFSVCFLSNRRFEYFDEEFIITYTK